MAESVALREAVASLVNDGDMVALEGFTHLIPFAAAYEIVRRNREADPSLLTTRGIATVAEDVA
jgi:acyl CoA:acetate/3-ketoacid CoA transferase alpha subunit